jgi:hypothetical protein
MTYDKQILQILIEVGEKGISVQQMSKHIFNQNVSLFYTPDYEDIRAYVQQYLLKNSKSDLSLIESTGQRGCYRLNTQHNADARQLMISFKEERLPDEKDEKPHSDVDLSLDLFD